METSLTVHKDQLAVVMRTGLTHWVATETGERIRGLLAQQNGHQFIAITELGITINTADVSEVCGLEQYDDLMKIKEGMRQCAFRKWHARKEECRCKQDWEKDQFEKKRAAERAESNRPLTPEEKQKQQAILAANRKILEDRGVLADSKRTGYTLKRSALDAYKRTHGNDYRVPPGTEVIEDTGDLQEAIKTF